MILRRCRIAAHFDGGLEPGASGVLFEQGDWIAGWALFLERGDLHLAVNLHGRNHELVAPVADDSELLVVDLSVEKGELDVVVRDGDKHVTEGAFDVGVMGPWASDGAFLTVGYARHFPVSDRYQPPALEPSNFTGLVFDTSPAAAFDFAAEFARAMRHQ